MCVTKRDLFCYNFAFIPTLKFKSFINECFSARRYIDTSVKGSGSIEAMNKVSALLLVALE